MTAQYDNLLSGGEYEVCVTAPRSQCVNDVNPSVLLPPGHPDGFGASEELIERASNLLICEYAMPQNCKPENVGFCLPPRKEGDSKQWITGRLKKFHQGFIASAIRKGDKCYGVGHAVFSNLLVIDVDNMECDDKNIVRDGLRGLGWKFKVFDSGRGLHFWIFFSDLPYELLKRYGSGPNVMKQVEKPSCPCTRIC